MRQGLMCGGDYFGPREYKKNTARFQCWDGSATTEGGSARKCYYINSHAKCT
jgi:hypothetical protein